MTRRTFVRVCVQALTLGAASRVFPGTARGSTQLEEGPPAAPGFDRLEKPLSEWRKILGPQQFEVLFEEGTEPPFSSLLNQEKRKGLFICAACFLPLFDSSTKYESGTGWPSFWAPIEGRLDTWADYRLFLPRTEYHCARCRGHQGHIFDDGPRPTGKRWCNNGIALRFVPASTPAPELRS